MPSRKKSPRSRVNPLKKRKRATKKSPSVFDVMPLLTRDRKRIKSKSLGHVNNFIRSGGQIKDMRPIEPADMNRVIHNILRDKGKIPLSHRLASHRYTTAKKSQLFSFPAINNI